MARIARGRQGMAVGPVLGMVAVLLAWPLLVPAVASAQGGPVKWRHGIVPPKADTVFQIIGVEKGFFRELGLDVEVKALQTGNLVLKALVAGELETADIAPSGTLVAIEQGAAVKFIGTNNPGVPYLLYAKREIGGLRELQGRIIGIASPNALAHVLPLAMLEREGMDPRRVTWVSVGADASRFQALLAGKVDATVTHLEFLPLAREHGLKVLAETPDILPDYVRDVLTVRGPVLRDRADQVLRFAIAFTRGTRYALENREEAIAVAAKLTGKPRQQVDWIYDWFVQKKALEPNFYLNPKSLQFLQELNVRLKLQRRVLPEAQVATWEVQRQVIAALGEYRR